jgi:hypothetical protein
MAELSLIPLKNNLFQDYRESTVKRVVIERLRELDMMAQKYKLDAELLTFVVNLIEHLVVKKDKIDKKKLAISIMRDVFSATDDDIELISRNIEYLHANKGIKKVSYYRLFKTAMREWFRMPQKR